MTFTRPPLYVVGSRRAAEPRCLVDVLSAAARGGADLIQIREKEEDDAEVVALARRVVASVQGTGARVLVNERFDLALAAGAHGVHMTSGGLRASTVRPHVGRDFLVARSVHDLGEVRCAAAEGVDFMVFGSVFDTPGKQAQGIRRLREACQAAGPPVLAIGGVDPARVPSCLRAGAAGVAVIRAVVAAAAPEEAARSLRCALDGEGPVATGQGDAG